MALQACQGSWEGPPRGPVQRPGGCRRTRGSPLGVTGCGVSVGGWGLGCWGRGVGSEVRLGAVPVLEPMAPASPSGLPQASQAYGALVGHVWGGRSLSETPRNRAWGGRRSCWVNWRTACRPVVGLSWTGYGHFSPHPSACLASLGLGVCTCCDTSRPMWPLLGWVLSDTSGPLLAAGEQWSGSRHAGMQRPWRPASGPLAHLRACGSSAAGSA